MAIKRDDKVERMKSLLESKIKDCVYEYTKLCNFVYSNMRFDKENGWHYECSEHKITHALDDREKCALELTKLLIWLERYVRDRKIRDEKRDTDLVCYEFKSSKRYLDPVCGKKFLYRKYIIEFEIGYVFKKNKTYSVSREHVELEWVNERLIRKGDVV
jgi:hypothetical protein